MLQFRAMAVSRASLTASGSITWELLAMHRAEAHWKSSREGSVEQLNVGVGHLIVHSLGTCH